MELFRLKHNNRIYSYRFLIRIFLIRILLGKTIYEVCQACLFYENHTSFGINKWSARGSELSEQLLIMIKHNIYMYIKLDYEPINRLKMLSKICLLTLLFQGVRGYHSTSFTLLAIIHSVLVLINKLCIFVTK